MGTMHAVTLNIGGEREQEAMLTSAETVSGDFQSHLHINKPSRFPLPISASGKRTCTKLSLFQIFLVIIYVGKH